MTLVTFAPWTMTSASDGTMKTVTSNLTNRTSGSSTAHLDYIRDINFCAMGVVVVSGLALNTLALSVFAASSRIRHTTTGRYLMALAVADMLYLLGECLRWLHSYRSTGRYFPGVQLMYTFNWLCKSVHYVRYMGKLSSAWVTVAITAERFVTVSFPLRVSSISTRKTTYAVILSTFAASCALATFPYWTIGLKLHNNNTRCHVYDLPTYNAMNWVILRIGSLLLPAAIILTLTTLLVYNLQRARRKRRQTLHDGQACHEHTRDRLIVVSMETQLTSMLLAVSCSFLLLRLPYAVSYYINEYKEELWHPPNRELYTTIYHAHKLCDIVSTLNYAINFFLYCVCGSTFRQELKTLVTCSAQRCCISCNAAHAQPEQDVLGMSALNGLLTKRSLAGSRSQDILSTTPIHKI